MNSLYQRGFLLAFVLLAGCTWVQLSDEGARVAVLSAGQVEGCERVGTTRVEVLDRTIVDRDAQKVAVELETLARNRVAGRADTLVASSPVESGAQSFILYRCAGQP